MKKLKLFFAAFALLLGVSNVMAQKDVTSQYITNATLSNGLTGWTVSNFNAPVNGSHRNVNNDKIYSNATVGYASEAYAGWDKLSVTSYGLTQTIKLPKGHYTLVNYSFFRQGQGYNTNPTKSLANLKAGENQVAIKTLGSITAAGYANSQWEGAVCFDSKMYRNTLDFTIDADNTEIEIGLVGEFDEMRSWCIAGMFELINNDILATMDAPFDVTGYITNAGFEYRNVNGWTLSEEGAIGVQNNDQGFKSGWYFAEKWQPSTDGALTERSMSQTLTGLPAGFYKLTANLGGNGTYIKLNNKIANWTEDKDYTVGYVLAENEDLVITAGKTAEGSANWIHFDNFRLQFCGDVAAALTTLLAQVSDYEGTIPSAAYTALQTDVAAYDKSYSDVDELLAAIDAVQNLYNAADELVYPYSRYEPIRSAVLATKSDVDVTTADALVEAATTVEGINNAITSVRNALTSSIAGIVNETIDLTAALIDNASPGIAGNTDYWTNSSAPTLQYQLYEFYDKASATSKQKIAAQLPVGYYTLTVIGFTREGYDGFINAGEDNHQTLVGVAAATVNNRNQGNEWIAQGNGVNAMTFNLTEPTSNLEIGINSGTEGDKWTCWRSFKLEFLGTAPLAKFQKDLADAAEVANDHATNDLKGNIPTAAYNAFTTAVSTAATQNTTTDDCLQAIQDIEDATIAADACVSPYADFNALKEKANTLQAVANDNAEANTTLGNAITEQTAAADAATTAAAVETATSTLKAAMVTYVGAANPVGNEAEFDCTFMLTNPDVTPFWTGAWNVRPEGWYNDQDGGNFQVMANEKLGPGGEVFMEYWSEKPAQSGFVLCQKVTLSKGTYRMSGRVAANFDNQGGSVQNVFFAANNAVGTQINSETLIDAACEFVQGSADPVLVKIGMIATEGNQARWMAINKIQLFKVPAKTYTVSEDDEWDNSQSGAGDVTLNRTIIVGYNTLVLPFNMTQDEVEATFGEGSVVYELNSFENEVIGFKTADGISPNKPCILKATEAGTSYDIKGRTIVAGDANPTSTVGAVSLIGSYDDEFIVPQTGDNYVVSKGNLYLVNSEVKIKGTRAYFNVVGNQAREISFDGVLTGIATVEKGELKKVFTGDIFDLTGRKVKNPSNGIFVVEGKKVVF